MTRHVRDITTSNLVKKVVRKQGAVFSSRVYIDGVFEHLSEVAGQQNTVHLMDQRSRMATIRLGNALGDTTPAIKYELENNLNSSAVLLDVNGTLVNSQEYLPFGETSFGSYGKKRYQYTGKERDVTERKENVRWTFLAKGRACREAALYYYGARYYHTTLCRFVSVDPLAPKFADLSPYNYAGNKPIAKVDIDGLQEENRQETPRASTSTNNSQENSQTRTESDLLKVEPLQTDNLSVPISIPPSLSGLKSTASENSSLNQFRMDFVAKLYEIDAILIRTGVALVSEDAEEVEGSMFTRETNESIDVTALQAFVQGFGRDMSSLSGDRIEKIVDFISSGSDLTQEVISKDTELQQRVDESKELMSKISTLENVNSESNNDERLLEDSIDFKIYDTIWSHEKGSQLPSKNQGWSIRNVRALPKDTSDGFYNGYQIVKPVLR